MHAVKALWARFQAIHADYNLLRFQTFSDVEINPRNGFSDLENVYFHISKLEIGQIHLNLSNSTAQYSTKCTAVLQVYVISRALALQKNSKQCSGHKPFDFLADSSENIISHTAPDQEFSFRNGIQTSDLKVTLRALKSLHRKKFDFQA